MKLPLSFYQSNDVVSIAKSLLGKTLITCSNGVNTGGLITETEAYAGVTDKASHAYRGLRTKRTDIMYQKGGHCYVYLCYGIHYLFNVVTGEKDVPHAVLIRGIFPSIGLKEILSRRNRKVFIQDLTNGPGKVSNALDIKLKYNGLKLDGNIIWIEDHGFQLNSSDIIASKRIGIDYAEEDSNLPYRFILTEKALYLNKALFNYNSY